MKTDKKYALQPSCLKFPLFLVLVSVGLALIPEHATAQTETEDVIYLKNGGILRGEILEIRGDKTIKIKTAGRNVFVVQMNEVDKIIEEKIPDAVYYKTSGYLNHTGIEFLSGADTITPHFNMMNGYRFSPHFAAGVGIGYMPYSDPLDLIPVYFDLNLNLKKANASPFLFLKAGYAFSVHSEESFPLEDHQGGWMLNPGIGIQFNLRNGFRWYLNAGYNVNNARFDEEGFQGGSIENELSYRRVMFGLGFAF